MLFKFMSFLDGIAYSADNDTVDFSVERLGSITMDDVVHYLHFKAYGTQHPAEDDFNNPPLCCFVTLLYHKKAISYFLRSAALEVNNVISKSDHTISIIMFLPVVPTMRIEIYYLTIIES
jgi:hypothetical protein